MTHEGQGAAPGWYPTPDGHQRYWDGRQWTNHVAPLATPHPYAAAQQDPRLASQSDTRPWYAKKRFIIPIATFGFLFFLAMLGSLAPDPDPTEQSQQSSSPTSAQDAAPATSSLAPEEEPATPEPTAEAQAVQEAPADEPAMAVTAQAMLDDLEANALAASAKYMDTRVTVTGKLDNIDASGNYFSLTGTDEFTFITDITVDIDESHHETVSGFTMGQDVTVTGTVTGVGEIMGYSIDPETIG